MSSKGYVNALLNPLPADHRRVLNPAFEHVMDDARLGGNDKATNFSWYRFESTTAAVANEEFSIRHGQGIVPSKIVPVLDLNLVNSQLVPLQVSQAPDAQRIYLKSTSTNAVFVVYVEF